MKEMPTSPPPLPPPPPSGITRGPLKKESLFSVKIISQNFSLVKNRFEEILDKKNKEETAKNEEDSNAEENTKRSKKIKDRRLFQCYKNTLLHELEKLHTLINTLENYPLLKEAILVELESILENFEKDLNKPHKTVEYIFSSAYAPRKIDSKKVTPPGFVHFIAELEGMMRWCENNPDFLDHYKQIQALQKEYEKATSVEQRNKLVEKAKERHSQVASVFEETSRKLNETNSNSKNKPGGDPTLRKTSVTSNGIEDLSTTLTQWATSQQSTKRVIITANHELPAKQKTFNTNKEPLKIKKPTEPGKYTTTEQWKSFGKTIETQLKITLEKEKEKDALKKKKEILTQKFDAVSTVVSEKIQLIKELELVEERIEALENDLQKSEINDVHAPLKDLSNKREIQLFYLYTALFPPVMMPLPTTSTLTATTPSRDFRGFYIQKEGTEYPIPLEKFSPSFVTPKKSAGGKEWKQLTFPLGFLSESEKQALVDFILPGENFEDVQKIINDRIQSGFSDEKLSLMWIMSIATGLAFRTPEDKTPVDVNLHIQKYNPINELLYEANSPDDITQKTAHSFQKDLIERLQNEKDVHFTIVSALFEQVKETFQNYYQNKKQYHQLIAIDMLVTVLPTQPDPRLFGLPEDAFSTIYDKINEKIAQETRKQLKEEIMAYAFRDAERIKLLSATLSAHPGITTNLDPSLDLQNFEQLKKGIEDALDDISDLREICSLLSIPDSLFKNIRIEKEREKETEKKREMAKYFIEKVHIDTVTVFLDNLSEEDKANFVLKSMVPKTLLAAVPIDTLKNLMKKQYEATIQNIQPEVVCARRDDYLAAEEKIKEEKKQIAQETKEAQKAIEAEKTKRDAEIAIKNRNDILGPTPDEDVPLEHKIKHLSQRVNTLHLLPTNEKKLIESNDLLDILQKLIHSIKEKDKNEIKTLLNYLNPTLGALERIAPKTEALNKKFTDIKAKIFDLMRDANIQWGDTIALVRNAKESSEEEIRKIREDAEEKIAQAEKQTAELYEKLQENKKKLEENSITPESILDKDKSRAGWLAAKKLFMERNGGVVPTIEQANIIAKNQHLSTQRAEFLKFFTAPPPS